MNLGTRYPGLSLDLFTESGQALEQTLCDDIGFWRAHEDSGVLTALGKLVVRPWFTRTWVIQELTLVQEPIVLCRAQKVSWNLLSGVVGVIIRLQIEGLGEINGQERKSAIEAALADLVTCFNMI